MNLQALIEKMRLSADYAEKLGYHERAADTRKLCEAAEAMYEGLEGSFVDFDKSTLAKHLGEICKDVK